LERYKSIKKYSDEFSIPCKGIYVDVVKNEDVEKVEEMEEFRTTLNNYKKYKTQVINGTEGSFKLLFLLVFNNLILLGYRRQLKPQVIKIYFATLTFDLITKR
jgi:hypothetical protein